MKADNKRSPIFLFFGVLLVVLVFICLTLTYILICYAYFRFYIFNTVETAGSLSVLLSFTSFYFYFSGSRNVSVQVTGNIEKTEEQLFCRRTTNGSRRKREAYLVD